MGENSYREEEWERISGIVKEHVKNYTVPQYGDYPNDPITEWTVKDCVRAIEKYCKRNGKNAREGQDQLDFLKIAHIAGIAFHKGEKK